MSRTKRESDGFSATTPLCSLVSQRLSSALLVLTLWSAPLAPLQAPLGRLRHQHSSSKLSSLCEKADYVVVVLPLIAPLSMICCLILPVLKKPSSCPWRAICTDNCAFPKADAAMERPRANYLLNEEHH